MRMWLRGDGQLDDDPGSADGDREGNANVAMIAKDDAADGLSLIHI